MRSNKSSVLSSFVWIIVCSNPYSVAQWLWVWITRISTRNKTKNCIWSTEYSIHPGVMGHSSLFAISSGSGKNRLLKYRRQADVGMQPDMHDDALIFPFALGRGSQHVCLPSRIWTILQTTLWSSVQHRPLFVGTWLC